MGRVVKQEVDVPVIIQHVGGDLRLKSRQMEDLVVDGEGCQAQQISDGQPYLVRCDGDCRVTVPYFVDVIINQVGGDAKIADVDSRVEVQIVGGDLVIRNVAEAVVGIVGGDLSMKRIDGAVQVGNIGGDGTIRDVMGGMRVDHVGADLFVRGVDGDCLVNRVGADLVLHIDFEPGNEYHFSAGGDVLCRVDAETNARLVVPRHTEIMLDADIPVNRQEEGDRQILTFGAGAALVHITPGADLRLVGAEEDYEFDLGVQIDEEVEARLSDFEEKLTEQLSGLDERISASAAQWASQAERWAERAQEQVEQFAERFSRGTSRSAGRQRKRGPRRIDFAWSSGTPRPAAPRSEPVREEERLMILQMVQDGKITIEDAERLLSALDARE